MGAPLARSAFLGARSRIRHALVELDKTLGHAKCNIGRVLSECSTSRDKITPFPLGVFLIEPFN